MNHLDTYRLSRLLRKVITLAEIAKGFNNHEGRREEISVILHILNKSTDNRYPAPIQEETDLITLLISVLQAATAIEVHTVVRHRLNFFISVCYDQLEMLKHRENNPVLDDSQIRYLRWADPSMLEPKTSVSASHIIDRYTFSEDGVIVAQMEVSSTDHDSPTPPPDGGVDDLVIGDRVLWRGMSGVVTNCTQSLSNIGWVYSIELDSGDFVTAKNSKDVIKDDGVPF